MLWHWSARPHLELLNIWRMRETAVQLFDAMVGTVVEQLCGRGRCDVMATTNKWTECAVVAAPYSIATIDATCDMHDYQLRPAPASNHDLATSKLRPVRCLNFRAIVMPTAATVKVRKSH